MLLPLRGDAVQRALMGWAGAHPRARVSGEQLLINEDGPLHQETFARLLEQRDNRRVTYQE